MRLMQKLVDHRQLNEPIDIRVGADERLIDEEMARFNLPLAVLLGIVAIGLFRRRLCSNRPRPSASLADSSRGSCGSLRPGQRASDGLPGEIMPLVRELNAMITANRSIVEQARVLAGNFAHALKMPLAVMTEEARQLEQRGMSARPGCCSNSAHA